MGRAGFEENKLMPRFFTGEIYDGAAVITGEDARHISLSLRMKKGETVTVCDNAGSDFNCVISSIAPDRVELSVVAAQPSQGEPSVAVTLYQAIPKGDKLETIIQKAVELGASRIVPVVTRRCVSRPDKKSMARKIERYAKIALEAAKQCGRGKIPEVEPPLDFEDAVEKMRGDSLAIFLYENADAPLGKTLQTRLGGSVSILVGSEGGFEREEADYAIERGLLALSLGSRILRCETAPLAAITAILCHAGDI